MISILAMLVGAAIAIFGFYLIFTSVDAMWGDACPHCTYSYRGLPASTSRCPECGAAVDRESRGYVERSPVQLLCGLLLLIVGSAGFGAAMVLG